MSSKQGKSGSGKSGKASGASTGAVVPAVRQRERVFEAAKRDGNKVGKVHGLLLTAWWNGVLDAMATGKAQWTDAQLAEAVLAEYPNRGAHQSPTAYRSYYNSQRHGLGGQGLHAMPYRVPKAQAPAPVVSGANSAVPPVGRSRKGRAVQNGQ